MSTELEGIILDHLCTQKWFVNELFAYKYRGKTISENKWEKLLEKYPQTLFNIETKQLIVLIKVVFLFANLDEARRKAILIRKKFIRQIRAPRRGTYIIDLNPDIRPWVNKEITGKIAHIQREVEKRFRYAESLQEQTKELIFKAIEETTDLIKTEIQENKFNLRELFGANTI